MNDMRSVRSHARLQPHGRSLFRTIALLLCSAVLGVFGFGFLYNRHLTAQSTGTQMYVIGAELVDLGAYAEAIDVLKKAAYLDPKDARIFYEMGNGLHFAGNTEAAAGPWAEALRLDPNLREKPPYTGKLLVPAQLAPRPASLEKLKKEADELWGRKLRLFEFPSAEAAGLKRASDREVEKQKAILPYP